MQYRVLRDTVCQHYLHEVTHYYREGLVERKLCKGEIVELVKKWSNFYGSYCRVKKHGDDYEYDIDPNDLQAQTSEHNGS